MKYFQKKCVYQGIKFDSEAERDRYIELKAMEKKGKIRDLELQKFYELLPKQTILVPKQLKTKTKWVERVDEQAITYHADFYYYDAERKVWVVEEVKSSETAKARDYPLRRKLMKVLLRKMNEAEYGKKVYIFNEIIVDNVRLPRRNRKATHKRRKI